MNFFKKILSTSIQNRKHAHLSLAKDAVLSTHQVDPRFYYEPMLSGHPVKSLQPINFLNKKSNLPIWISGMTGGTRLAKKINQNLAKACNQFGMSMCLGSCGILLKNDTFTKDFAIRPILGDQQLLFANLGIAQIEEAVLAENIQPINKLVQQLDTDGLVIHVNPIQEFLQPEGDIFKQSPLLTISTFLKWVNYPVIVKEVGQGMGPESLQALLKMPLAAIELAGFGGTNFAKVELLRNAPQEQNLYAPLAYVGHTTASMIQTLNYQLGLLDKLVQCSLLIVSGGITSFLDGYYLTSLSSIPSIYGQAGALLPYAKKSYKALEIYFEAQKKGLNFAKKFLKIRKEI